MSTAATVRPHPPRKPLAETDRLVAVQSYEVLDSLPEAAFDSLTEQAAQLCETPIAVLTLVDETRQWFKSVHGLSLRETPREIAFCDHAIRGEDMFEVEDASRDATFRTNPLVTGEPHIRFYAGIPLINAAGAALGALAVIDHQPRRLTGAQAQALHLLADRALDQLELRLQQLRIERALAEQQRLHAELERQATHLRDAQRIARLGSWEARLSDGRLSWTDEVFRITGVAPAQFGGSVDWFYREVIHPEDHERLVRLRDLALRGEARYDVTHRIRRPSGEIRHVHERAELMRDAEGAPAVLSGTIQDVTEQIETRLELQQSEERFRTVARATTDVIWDWDPASGTLWWSEGLKAVFGHEPAADAGLNFWRSHVHPDDCERVNASVRRALEGAGDHWSEEYRFARANGSFAHVLDQGYVLRDTAGNPRRMIGGMTDLSERKRMEDTLRQNEERIREQASLLDKAHDAILVRDLEHHITYWNKSAEELYGWTAEEVLGQKVSDLLYRDPNEFLEATRTVLDKGEWKGEIRQCTRSDSEVLVEGRWTLVRDAAGRPKSILAINSDITEKKRLEAQFLRVQRMESIGTLAGGIAHDLNNVLSPILMAVDLLRMKATDPTSLGVLATVEASARRGADMVRQVLSFARGMDGQRLPLRAKDVLRDIGHILQETFPKNIRCSTRAGADLPLLSGDATQLHQVLLNLCVNARDAMPHGGSLEVRADAAEIDEHYAAMNPGAEPGTHIVFTVTDSGHGIPAEMRDKIFDPFFTTKELGQGTGLGLSTVLAIVKSHGGFIQVQSAPGEGTAMKVYFPAAARETDANAILATDGPARNGSGELILLVEDEPAVRKITSRTLEARGYNLLTAADGAEAVALYAKHQRTVHLVLTDMMMPVMDGAATIQVLRRVNPQVRIIAASGLNDVNTRDKALQLGARRFLSKPYNADAMLKVIREVLDEG
jgi:PAS domain S-box-containing protein